MTELGRGTKVFDALPVTGRWRAMETPDDVLDVMDNGADGVIALVRDAGATFLAPIYGELAAVVCVNGTPRSHIGIVSREFQVPCIMAVTFANGEPANGDLVTVDCSGADGVLTVGVSVTAQGAAQPMATAAAPKAARLAAAIQTPHHARLPARSADRKQFVNDVIAYVDPITRGLNAERTALESQLIPVTAYVVTACIEAYYRYPEMMRVIDAAMPAEEIGRRARRPGCRVNTVYLWSIINFWLIGRRVMEMMDPEGANDLDRAYAVTDFWDRAAAGFRGDGTRQAADTNTVHPYDSSTVDALLAGAQPVDADMRDRVKRFNALLVSYLFLLYFDTRVGGGDSAYELPDGRTMLIRDFYNMSEGDFPWSGVAREVPHHRLVSAMVLDGASVPRVSDFGTSYTDPEDYLDHLVAYGLYEPQDDGTLVPVSLDQLDAIEVAVRAAQSAHYRNIAAMTDDEKIRCGAYVYFSFLLPFAEEAGVADQLDWTVPRDIPDPVYQMVSALRGSAGASNEDVNAASYSLIP
jgi:phosphohistidine swiveling domain-containing protein